MGLITNLHSFSLPLTSLGRIDCVLKLPPPPSFFPTGSIDYNTLQLNRELWLRPFEAISKDEITQPFQLVICASSYFQRKLRGTQAPAGRLREIGANSELKIAEFRIRRL